MCVCVCRPVYVTAVRPQSKHIVVIIDHGASVTETQLQIARDAALVILNAVDEHDKVGVHYTNTHTHTHTVRHTHIHTVRHTENSLLTNALTYNIQMQHCKW